MVSAITVAWPPPLTEVCRFKSHSLHQPEKCSGPDDFAIVWLSSMASIDLSGPNWQNCRVRTILGHFFNRDRWLCELAHNILALPEAIVKTMGYFCAYVTWWPVFENESPPVSFLERT